MNKRPISIRDANRVVGQWHRHSRPTGPRAKFAIAAEQDGQLVGVAIVGRPKARHLDDGWTAEVLRVATNGCRNACSFLYGACWRAVIALGYRRLVTYTLASEPGTSVKAAGGRRDGDVPADTWHRPSRPRLDADLFGEPVTPEGDKVRWIWGAAA